jgi:hypothetical protein
MLARIMKVAPNTNLNFPTTLADTPNSKNIKPRASSKPVDYVSKIYFCASDSIMGKKVPKESMSPQYHLPLLTLTAALPILASF